jgi:hypothetical protein
VEVQLDEGVRGIIAELYQGATSLNKQVRVCNYYLNVAATIYNPKKVTDGWQRMSVTHFIH